MKILVTGTAGFIGSFLAERLIARGDEVVGLDSINDYYDVNVKYGRLERAGIGVGKLEYNTVIASEKYPNYKFVQMNLDHIAGMDARAHGTGDAQCRPGGATGRFFRVLCWRCPIPRSVCRPPLSWWCVRDDAGAQSNFGCPGASNGRVGNVHDSSGVEFSRQSTRILNVKYARAAVHGFAGFLGIRNADTEFSPHESSSRKRAASMKDARSISGKCGSSTRSGD